MYSVQMAEIFVDINVEYRYLQSPWIQKTGWTVVSEHPVLGWFVCFVFTTGFY